MKKNERILSWTKKKLQLLILENYKLNVDVRTLSIKELATFAIQIQEDSLEIGVNWLGNQIFDDMADLINGTAILKSYEDVTDEEIKQNERELQEALSKLS